MPQKIFLTCINLRKQIKIITILFFTISSPLFGCKWCEKWQKNEPANPTYENKTDKKSTNSFYNEYLSKYYPKALIINDYFFEMCPTAVDFALQDILKILSNEEWFYYQDKPKGFKAGEFWEITLNQCSKIKKFLESALVNDKQQIYLLKPEFSFEENSNNNINDEELLIFFKKNGLITYQYFYAEYADRLTKLINEGLINSDIIKAQCYHSSLCSILKHLRDLSLYSTYEDAVKKQKELITILKSKLGFSNFAKDAEESYEL